ncbi:MAG: hypothetical protein M3N54_06095 [Acidobacteriota bacterium]|nr:hypothetical protein [Acidobacteriota bacterium]
MTAALAAVVAAVIAAVVMGLIVYLTMQARLQVELGKQREELATARASLKNAQESTRREAMDEFLADIRIEERHYTREHKILFMTRKILVRQERIFFRNIPLSNWVENEMPIEEGADLEKLAKAMSVFAPEMLSERPGFKLLR